MNNNYNILDHDLFFSDSKMEYVRLKWEYQRKAWKAEEEMKEIMPKVKKGGLFDEIGFTLATTAGSLTQLSGALTSFLSDGNYGKFNLFLEQREKFVSKYVSLIEKEIDEIAAKLAEANIAVDPEQLFIDYLKKSSIRNDIVSAADSIADSRKNNTHLDNDSKVAAHKKVVNYYIDKANCEFNDKGSGNDKKAAIFTMLIKPLNHSFLNLIQTDLGLMQIDPTGANLETDIINVGQKCSKLVFQMQEIQDAFMKNIKDDVFLMFILKKDLFQENGIADYEVITSDEVKRSNELYGLLTNEVYSEEEEKNMMAELISLNPFQSIYFDIILDKYFDPTGDLQRLAKEATINLTTRIENYLMNIYNEGDIGTLETTLELKEKILEAERKFCYSDSKAFKDVLFRQHFIELSRIANEMPMEEVVKEWQLIKDGNNSFAVDERADVDDEHCILILTRRFLNLNAALYHDTIRNLGLTDDQTEGDKNYAFYEEGENYLNFEEECKKLSGFDFGRDEDLSVQNYCDDKLASGEVVLGYFHYTRSMDVIGDGKILLITNKRIFTTKEKFTDFECISECKPLKKMILTYLIFEKNDGKTIQLPVSKELMLPAADMINRLISALKGTEYIANSVEVSKSKSAMATENVANQLKKGFGSLFGKKNKINEWICSCGSNNDGAFCSVCGSKKPE